MVEVNNDIATVLLVLGSADLMIESANFSHSNADTAKNWHMGMDHNFLMVPFRLTFIPSLPIAESQRPAQQAHANNIYQYRNLL